MKALHLHILLTLLLALVVTEPALAQRGGHGRRGQRVSKEQREVRRNFVKEVVAELKQGAGERIDREKLFRFERMAHAVVRHMSQEDFDALAAKPIAEKVNAVAALWKKMRDDMMEGFVKRQPPAVAAELRRLDTKSREKRIAELRVISTLEKSIAAALKHGIVDEAEADRLRGLPSNRQMRESSRLNREVFLAIHGEEISEKDKDRLNGLKGRSFWRDEMVRKFQLLEQIDASELQKIGKLDSKSRMSLAKAIKKGEGFEPFVKSGVISQKRAAAWAKMPSRDRSRLVRDIMRVHLPQMRRGIRISWKQMSKLSHEERGRFFMMNHEERLGFLKKKFPGEDWDKKEQQRLLRSQIDKELKALDSKLRSRLRLMMPSVAKTKLEEAFGENKAQAKKLYEQMTSLGWFRSAVPSTHFLRMKLSAEDRKAMRGLSTEASIDAYFVKFKDHLEKEARGVAEKAGKKLPANWEQMSGSQKVTWLNQNDLFMPWPERGRSRMGRGRGRGGRPDGMRRGRPGENRRGGKPRRRERRDKPENSEIK